jgi:hypothetical protein
MAKRRKMVVLKPLLGATFAPTLISISLKWQINYMLSISLLLTSKKVYLKSSRRRFSHRCLVDSEPAQGLKPTAF